MTDAHQYDNEVAPDNVYGHTLALLRRNLDAAVDGAVHLDLACGFGHIAEPLIDLHGVTYVGVDIDERTLESVRARGHEAHALDLGETGVLARLEKVLDGRALHSVTFLDGLEHMVDGLELLEAIGSLCRTHGALAVTSVPNVTHLDVGIKTVLGQWEYTEAGLLDRTHLQLYSAVSLRAKMRQAGLVVLDEDDVVIAHSDQHFPADHVALADDTTLGMWFRSLRGAAEPHGFVNQFVWALTPAPPSLIVPDDAPRPFLSVILRTQGRRPQELREALLCLAAQTDDDFEVLVVAHRTTVAEQVVVERLIDELPPGLARRTRLVLLDRGNRAAPLNVGLDEARGTYVGMLDDDDLVMGHWVEEFHNAARRGHNRVIRSLCLRQDAVLVEVRGQSGVMAVASPQASWVSEFSMIGHLIANQSPSMSYIYPRSLARDFGLRYDDSMTTTEDWDVLLRASELAGVTDTSAVTAIYHFWDQRESSASLHQQPEWLANQREIERRLDSRPFLLPRGEVRAVRAALLRIQELERAVQAQDAATQDQAAMMELERAAHDEEVARTRRLLARKEAILQRKNLKIAKLHQRNRWLRRAGGRAPAAVTPSSPARRVRAALGAAARRAGVRRG
jgi:SAM-dependent methyltransferase